MFQSRTILIVDILTYNRTNLNYIVFSTCQNEAWVCNEDNCIPTSCPSEGEAKVFKFGKWYCLLNLFLIRFLM